MGVVTFGLIARISEVFEFAEEGLAVRDNMGMKFGEGSGMPKDGITWVMG